MEPLKSNIKNSDIEQKLLIALKSGDVDEVKKLAKLRGKKLQKPEVDLLILSRIKFDGWFVLSHPAKKFRKEALRLRFLPFLTKAEKRLIFETRVSFGWIDPAREAAKEYGFKIEEKDIKTMLTVILKNGWLGSALEIAELRNMDLSVDEMTQLNHGLLSDKESLRQARKYVLEKATKPVPQLIIDFLVNEFIKTDEFYAYKIAQKGASTQILEALIVRALSNIDVLNSYGYEIVNLSKLGVSSEVVLQLRKQLEIHRSRYLEYMS